MTEHTSTKTTLEDLAIFGGRPAFAEALHVGRPNVGDRDGFLRRLNGALDRRWLTNDGPLLQEFEQRVAELLGVKHCLALCNGTVALMLAARATDLAGEVIVPSFTFAATAHALTWSGITPVFCDLDPATSNIDPAVVERLITPRTTGIIGVHVWGRPCDVEALEAIARRRRLRVLFDAAHAFGCSHRGRMIGSFGDAEILSFHATKILNTFEGGAIVTNDDVIARRVTRMRNFGFSDWDSVDALGINGKMSEASAAMGLTSLDALPTFIETNRRHYQQYRRELRGVAGVSLVEHDETEMSNYHYVIVEVDEQQAHVGRDDLQRVLHEENVLARRYFYPGCHAMEFYQAFHRGGSGVVPSLPHTTRLASRVLALPTGTAVSDGDVATVCRLIQFAVEHGVQLSERLAVEVRPLAR